MTEKSNATEIDTNEHLWQTKVKTSAEALSLAFSSKEFIDVVFQVGSNKEEITGHTAILFSRSPVLYKMFKGDFEQRFETRHGQQCQMIEVSDMEPAAFRAFLKFLYTDKLDIEPNLAMEMLYAAKYYMVPVLEDLVRGYIRKSLNIETIYAFCEEAIFIKDDKAIEECLEWIDEHTEEFIRSEKFQTLDKEFIRSFLARDTLEIQEVELFHAVVRWAKASCSSSGVDSNKENMRKTLSDILPLIRFPMMKFEEFGQLENKEILKKRDIMELLTFFSGGPSPSYSIVPRNSNASFIQGLNGEMRVRRFRAISSKGYVLTKKNAGITFKVDKPIELLGYGIYGVIGGTGAYDCRVYLFNNLEITTRLPLNEKICPIYFTRPILINPNLGYASAIKIEGPPTYCGDQDQKQIVCKSSQGTVTFTFEDNSWFDYDCTVATGQIPELIFRFPK